MLQTQTTTAAPVSIDALLSDIDGNAARTALKDIRDEYETPEPVENDDESDALPWWCAPSEVR